MSSVLFVCQDCGESLKLQFGGGAGGSVMCADCGGQMRPETEVHG